MKMRALKHVLFSVVFLLAFAVISIGVSAGRDISIQSFNWDVCCNCKALALLQFYAKELRGNLFAAYLTLGGFLLSLKTFIVVTMNDKLYQNPTYRQKWQANKAAKIPVGTLYSPLKKLSDLLFYAIGVSLLTAGAQFSIGFIDHWIAVAICIGLAICSFTLVVDCLWIIKQNLDTWIEYMDES